jgi:hypothetical protein
MKHSSSRFLLRPAALCLALTVAACQADRSQSYSRAEPEGATGGTRSAADEAAPAQAPAPPAEEAADADLARQLDPFATLAAIPSSIDSIKKFVRTAEVKGRVSDVLRTTLTIEDVAARHGGFVLDNRLSTQVEYQDRQPFSRDSAVEVTRFHVRNDLTLRVPYTRLDTTLRAIGRHIEFLDYRIVNADDITFRLLEEQLAQRRLAEHQQRLRSALQSRQERDGMGENADRLLSSRADADTRRLERLRLDDAVQYSTVKIALYQPAELRQAHVANTEFPRQQPPLAYRLSEALAGGWRLLEALLLGIIRLWGVILLAVLVYWLYKRFGSSLRARVRPGRVAPVSGAE